MKVELGNVATKVAEQEDEESPIVWHKLDGNLVTVVVFAPSTRVDWALLDIVHPRGLWAHASEEPPAWVASDSSELESKLAEHFGCPTGRPEGWTDVAEVVDFSFGADAAMATFGARPEPG